MSTSIRELDDVLDRADTAIDNWVLEQLEFNRACNVTRRGVRCENKAEWLQICRGCDNITPLCNEHFEYIVTYYGADDVEWAQCVKCHRCEHKLRDLMDYVPVGGNT